MRSATTPPTSSVATIGSEPGREHDPDLGRPSRRARAPRTRARSAPSGRRACDTACAPNSSRKSRSRSTPIAARVVSRTWSSLETPRLLLRPFAPDDAALVHAVYSDPEVMRYVATGPMADLAITAAAARGLRRPPAPARLLVLGRDRALERGADRRRRALPDAGRRDRARLHARRRRGGAAATPPRRPAAGWRSRSGSCGLDEVIALAEPANVASLHVLEKLGMRRDGERIAFGRPHAVFRGQRPASSASIPSRIRWRPNSKASSGAS